MFDTLSATWKELCKVHGTFCKKLTETPNCAANGFAEMRVGRESRKRRVHKTDREVLTPNDVFRSRRAGGKKKE